MPHEPHPPRPVSAQRLPFIKVQGLGNHFVLIDRRRGGEPISPELAMAMCDRYRGVGADGVLVVWPAQDADARMQVLNADGSEAGMCGNGLRCVAHYLYQQDGFAPIGAVLRLEAAGRVLAVARVDRDVYRVGMGRAHTNDPELPPATGGEGELSVAYEGRTFTGTRLSMGNPHWVLFVEDDPMSLARAVGAGLERHPVFPNRVNVSFVRDEGDVLRAVVYERGVGITQACGSGACAIGAAAVREGRRQVGAPMRVALPGGELRITVDPGGELFMEGEAQIVFTGEWPG